MSTIVRFMLLVSVASAAVGCGGKGISAAHELGTGEIAPHYRMTLLGETGSNSFSPYALNSNHKIVGSTSTGGYLWDPATKKLVNLGGAIHAFPNGINDQDQIIGNYFMTSGFQGCYWKPGTTNPVPVPQVSPIGNPFVSLNNSGMVVGYFITMVHSIWSPMVWSLDDLANPTSLPFLNGSQNNCSPTCINDLNQIVGSYSSEPIASPVFWSGPTSLTASTESITLQPGTPHAINNLGQMAGGGSGTAVYWEHDGSPETVICLSSDALGINDSATVVGNSYLPEPSRQVAYAWSKAVGLVDLNSRLDAQSRAAGWFLISAQAINSKGWIIGAGMLKGKAAGFLAEPLSH